VKAPESPVSKIEELDSIRGIAAVLVVLYHMPLWTPWLHGVQAIRNSFYMVDVFFVLSGFVMNLNYGDRLRGGKDLARFQLLRLGRVYPVHVLFLFVALAAATAAWLGSIFFGLNVPNGGAFKDNTVGTFVQQLLMVHALGFTRIDQPFNLPSWSISVEFYTYLVFGVVCLVSWVRARQSIFALLAGGSLLCLAMGEQFVGNFSQILQCFAGYFVGCLLASLVARFPRLCPRGSTLAAMLLMVLFLCFKTAPGFDVTIFLVSALLVLAIVSSPDDGLKAILRHRWLKFLGLISYSIYMSHTFVLWCCNQFVRVVLKRPEAVYGGISTPQLTWWGGLAWFLVALAATIVLSALVFKYVEDPWRLKAKEFVRNYLPREKKPRDGALQSKQLSD
jgi:peptidoglycan/LPS O-acetylase OafA/YrhL